MNTPETSIAEDWDEVEFSILERLEQAQEEALSEDELEEIKDKQDQVTRALLNEEISLPEYNERMKQFVVDTGAIRMETLPEFRAALELLDFEESDIREFLAHENDHMMLDQSKDWAKAFYQIQFLRDKNNRLRMRPSVVVEFSDDAPEEEVRRYLRDSISAHEDLSERDQAPLGEPRVKRLPPETYEEFSPLNGRTRESGEKYLNETLAHIETLKRYLAQERINGAEFGQAAGKRFVRTLDTMNYPRLSDSDRAEQIVQIRLLHKSYEDLFGGEYLRYRSGFLAEYGVAHAIADRIGFPVYYPSEEEDLHYGIDWWVDLEDGDENRPSTLLAVQVKTAETKFDLEDIIVPVRTQEDIDKLIDAHPSIRNSYEFRMSGYALLEYSQKFTNVIGCYIIVPPVGSEESRFNILTGTPDKEFVEALWKDIERKFLERSEDSDD